MNDTIDIHCTDKDQWITAKVVNWTDTWILCLVEGQVRLNLKKTKPNMYVGNLHGYEFVYKETNK